VNNETNQRITGKRINETMDYQLGHDESKPKFRKYPICLLPNDLDAPMNVSSGTKIGLQF